jgi:hypothetical protein
VSFTDPGFENMTKLAELTDWLGQNDLSSASYDDLLNQLTVDLPTALPGVVQSSIGGGTTSTEINPPAAGTTLVWDAQQQLYSPSKTPGLLAGNDLSDVASKTSALNNLGITRSNVTLTWSGGITSATATITHGLGAAPTAIVFSPLQTIGGGPITAYVVTGSVNSTTFEVAGVYATTLSGSIVFAWIAIL